MKKYVLLLISLLSISANAKYVDGIIKFNDGHQEKGLIKSFLDQKWFYQPMSTSLEKNLNLDDKFMFFKVDKNADEKKFSIDEIKEVVLINEDSTFSVFRVVLLKDVNKDGTVKNEGSKVYLPLLKEGKINIFGLKYKVTYNNGLGGDHEEVYYYQNAKQDYAINYSGYIESAMASYIFDSNFRQKFLARLSNPLKDLFKDCPLLVISLDTKLSPYIDEDKEFIAEEKRLKKEFKKLPKEEQKNLLTIHYYDFNYIDKLITEYQNCN